MPSIKDIAKRVAKTHWGLPEIAFDAMWSALTPDTTTSELPLDGPSLAGAAPHLSDIVYQMKLFKRVSIALPGERTGEELIEYTVTIDDATFTNLIRNYFDPSTDDNDAAPRVMAVAYTHDLPQAHDLTEKQVEVLVGNKGTFVIFIHHKRGLSEDSMGRIYFRGRDMHTPRERNTKPRAYIRPREYHILRHLLKHSQEDHQRFLQEVVEQCWFKQGAADDLRLQQKKRPDLYIRLTVTARAAFHNLNKVLEGPLGMRVRTVDEKCELDPWPETYCVIEER